MATGGGQSLEHALSQNIAGYDNLLQSYKNKVILTHPILSDPSGAVWKQRLSGNSNPKVVIIGSSHSAFSTAWTLLQDEHGVKFQESGIEILYRTVPKLYFGSAEAALQAGYADFDQDDICPLTKRLYRLAGLRFDGRELLMQLWQIDGNPDEPRVKLRSLNTCSRLAQKLDQADLIVPAFGYRPRTVDLRDSSGEKIRLNADHGGSLVDDECRVLEEWGDSGESKPIDNLFAMGLASGFVPSGDLGGEPSFRGQTNGFWLYQNGVGNIVLDQLTQVCEFH
jgi:hypothetical protein